MVTTHDHPKEPTTVRGMTVALFLIIAITLGAFGQIALKYGMKQFGARNAL